MQHSRLTPKQGIIRSHSDSNILESRENLRVSPRPNVKVSNSVVVNGDIYKNYRDADVAYESDNNGSDAHLNTIGGGQFGGNNDCSAGAGKEMDEQNGSNFLSGNYLLWISTPVAASFSVAIIIAAISGPNWLFTSEKISKRHLNSTNFRPKGDDTDYITKFTKSSLWIVCTHLDNDPMESICSTIDYFTDYYPDPIDSTQAIPYAITQSTPFFLIANFIHIISYFLFLLAMFSNRHRLHYFVSGILFIISGLLMLIGVILYISIFKSEVGSKLRAKSSLQPPLFTYRYGYSFVLYIVGFSLTELAGILNVFLYMTLHDSQTYTRPSPCFNNYSKLRKVSIASPLLYNVDEQRFIFRKDPNCNVHSKQWTKSLNQLYTEPAPDFSPFDYPNLVRKKSVSTATDNEEVKTSITDRMSDICGIGRTLFSDRTKLSEDAYRRTTPRRSRAKNIYVIENNGENSDANVIIVEPMRFRRNSLCSRNANLARTMFQSNRSLGELDKLCVNEAINFDSAAIYNNKCENKAFNNGSRTLPRNFLHQKDNRRVSASGVFQPMRSNFDAMQHLNNSGFSSLGYIDRNNFTKTPQAWPKIILNGHQLKNGTNSLAASRENVFSEKEGMSPTFDLDRIERERRKSHASLFDGLSIFDFQNEGTAV